MLRLPVPLPIDAVRLPHGEWLTVRLVTPADAGDLAAYFSALSVRSRYDRLAGASDGLPATELARLLRQGEDGRHAVLAEVAIDGGRRLVGEARYRLDPVTGRMEFGLSVLDAWHRRGIGRALIGILERIARDAGAGQIFGDVLRTNERIQGLLEGAGYRPGPFTGDWRETRYLKDLAAQSSDECDGSRIEVVDPRRAIVSALHAPAALRSFSG